MSSELLLSSSHLLSYLNDVPLCSSHSTKGSECSDNCLSPNEENFELPCKGVLIIDALKRSNGYLHYH